MATSVDAKIQKSTKFPVEFNQKVDMQKVRTEVVKKWIASRISDILGNEDDVVIEMIYNLIEEKRFPDIKKIQIQLTGFLDKDTASFCKELWKLCLSAQSSPQGVPKELLEAKKLEIIQEKIESEKLAEQARKRRDDEQNRERDINAIRQRERGDRGRGGPGRGGDSWRGGRGGRGDDRNREFDRRPGRDFDRRGPRHSRSPRRRDSRERSYRAPPLREADTYVPRGRGEPRRDMRDQRRRPSESVSPPPKREASESRSRSPPRRRYRSQSTSRTPPRRRRSVSRSRSPIRRNSYRGRGAHRGARSPDRGNRRRRSPSVVSSVSRSPRPGKRRRSPSDSSSRSPPPRRRRRNSSSVSRSRSISKTRSVTRSKSRPASVSRSPSPARSRSRERARETSTPDDNTETRARKGGERDERRLTRSYSRSITPRPRRRRSSTRSISRDGRDRKRRRSVERYTSAGRKRRDSSPVSSPVIKNAGRADTEESNQPGSPMRGLQDSKADEVGSAS